MELQPQATGAKADKPFHISLMFHNTPSEKMKCIREGRKKFI
jgi:hypothetical protein